MTHSLGSYRAGASLVSPHTPTMDSSLITDKINYDTHEWEKHFYKEVQNARGDIASPKIYRGSPVLSGGIKPRGFGYASDGMTWIYNKRKEYELVSIKELRNPTEKEYNAHFKPLYDNFSPMVKGCNQGGLRNRSIENSFKEVVFFKK